MEKNTENVLNEPVLVKNAREDQNAPDGIN